jgi:hypothetical protein
VALQPQTQPQVQVPVHEQLWPQEQFLAQVQAAAIVLMVMVRSS